jgi:hypothetical protein
MSNTGNVQPRLVDRGEIVPISNLGALFLLGGFFQTASPKTQTSQGENR